MLIRLLQERPIRCRWMARHTELSRLHGSTERIELKGTDPQPSPEATG